MAKDNGGTPISTDGPIVNVPRHLKPQRRSNGRALPRRLIASIRRRDDAEHAAGVVPLTRRLQAMVPGSYRRIAWLAGLSFAGGMLEAGLLVLLARTAVAIADDTQAMELPWIGSAITVRVAILTLVVMLAGKLITVIAIARSLTGLSVHALSTVRMALVTTFIGASWPVQASQRQGYLQELMTTHAQRVTNVTRSLATFIFAGMNVLTLLSIAMVVEPVGAIAIIVTGAALSLGLRPFAALLRRNAKRAAEAGERLAGTVAQVVNTIRELHVFGTGRRALAEFQSLQDRHAHVWGRSRFFMALGPEIYRTCALLLLIGALGLVAVATPSDVADIGAVVLLLLRTFSYGQQTQAAYQALNEAVPFMDRLRHQIELYAANQAPEREAPVSRIGQLELDRVRYEYTPGRPVLHGISATIERGEAVGIIGPSGSGKSTLLQILLRLREPTGGRLFVDGIDACQLELQGWYERVAFVPQDPRLIDGTVAENITFYRDIPEQSVHEAAAMANLADEIAILPRGYDEVIGPEDTTLSGGQQQRLTIARALAGRPDLLVLDEPTSALDMRSEARIQETLRGIHGQVTLIVVAHRLSTIAQCDRVMALIDGEIQGFDGHEALLATSPFYEETLQLSVLQHTTAGES